MKVPDFCLKASSASFADELESHLDARLRAILTLLEYAPLHDVHTVLDIGMGGGQVSKWLANRGKAVMGTGIAVDSYGVNALDLSHDFGINVVECLAEALPFPDKSFDAVVMCHVLEHCPNVGLALQEVRRVLVDQGFLLIFVPKHSGVICAGHISMGWNIGQLMYVLLINGFNVKDGNFIVYYGNVCGFVQKDSNPLPQLRGDQGDIKILSDAGRFPLPVVTRDGRNDGDGFRGELKCVNWKWPEVLGEQSLKARLLIKLIPRGLKKPLGSILVRAGHLLLRNAEVNPKVLGF